jgi:peptidoglycan/xylan/chitin deacetylase (PgdA/CDA1 family)
MGYLRDHRYTPLTVTQLARTIADRAAPLPDRPVVITFDDGLADFYTGALPALVSHGFVATLYVTTGFVGHTSRWLASLGEGTRPMLTWGQIAEVQASGVECGAHSVSHPQLDLIARASARDEITGGKDQLEQRLGRPVETFAYPNGYYDATVRRLVGEAGYRSACGVKHAMSARTDDCLALARIMVPYTTGMDLEGFGNLLTGKGLPVAPARRRLGTRGWRLARRASTFLKGVPYSVTRNYVVNQAADLDPIAGDPASSPAPRTFGDTP